MWDQSSCYTGYPTASAPNAVLMYWACQLAFYSALLVSQFKDIRRKVPVCVCVTTVCVRLCVCVGSGLLSDVSASYNYSRPAVVCLHREHATNWCTHCSCS